MKPIEFEQATKILSAPGGMTPGECGSLPVWSDGKELISCWRPSFKERLRILFTGKVWLSVLGGQTQPPVFLTGEYIFIRPPFWARVRNSFDEVVCNIISMWKEATKAAKQRDKRIHLACGFLISLVIGFFIPLLGFAFGCIAGAVKEWWDSKGHGTVELMDFVFTCIGAAIALIPSFILHSIVW